MNKDESITGLMNGMKKDADEILGVNDDLGPFKPTCNECQSTNLTWDQSISAWWCNDCWVWVSEADSDEQSREQMDAENNAVLDKENR